MDDRRIHAASFTEPGWQVGQPRCQTEREPSQPSLGAAVLVCQRGDDPSVVVRVCMPGLGHGVLEGDYHVRQARVASTQLIGVLWLARREPFVWPEDLVVNVVHGYFVLDQRAAHRFHERHRSAEVDLCVNGNIDGVRLIRPRVVVSEESRVPRSSYHWCRVADGSWSTSSCSSRR